MKWTRGYRSDNVEDRRAQGGRSASLGAGVLQLPLLLFRRFGVVGLAAGFAVVYFAGGLGGGTDPQVASSRGAAVGASAAREEEMVQFISFVLDDVQRTWSGLLGPEFRPAKLVLFRGATASGCGMGQAAMGPFYCSRDERAYIDLGFYAELKQRFGAPGDFAQAYVLAHEVGHHVQHLLGTTDRVHAAPRAQQNGPEGLSTRLELQADCFAGVWASSAKARQLLDVGDAQEALRAAAAIGDDTLQKQAGGRVAPESWTHGSSTQRVRWFQRGMENGAIEACDTFSVPTP